ncbi:MAG: tetratricopeptide repeat protein [Bacteroidales bacterium]|nr:tetratricopeptide repeat protein [Bacteroidales bacterium]
MKDHKLAAIVFTDIVGYTKKMEADEEGTMKLLARQKEIIFPMVKEFGGEVIKEIGDGLLMMFTSANRAVRFTMAVQEQLKDDELTIRAGIHIGDVIFEEGDVFGSAVNIAARIEPLAPAGGICISEDVRSQIRNQNDIITTSIGKKELKGVDQAVEIYQVISEELEQSQKRVPFFKDLWQRRVLQITGIYLLLSYLVSLGIEFMVKEYMLSPHLTNLIWYILLSLIPSIIMISYFHGKKGVSKWTKVELIGMPLNIVAAVLVLVFVFKGKDLGAITTKVTVQNEDGEKIEKLVIKNEFRKKIFIFNIENITGDTALDYLQYSIPEMTEYDLSQDILLTSQTAMGIYSRIAEAGYESAVGLPLTQMKRFAEQRHMNYFMFGQLNFENGEYILDVKLYETRLTRQAAEISLKDKSPFDLVDQLTIEIKRAMGLPESHISETIDLPISEIFTASEKALYYFSMAIMENALNNWTENVRLLEIVLKEDPDFAIAHVMIAISYLNINNVESAWEALQTAMDDRHMHKLPERQQFIVKYVYYIIGQEPDKAMIVVKMWVDLYPDDIMAHSTLGQRYALRNMFPEAIREYKEILRLDPEQYQFISTLAEYYLQLGNFDSSLAYFERYAQKLPKQAQSYRNLGDYYSLTGDMVLAKENYEKALVNADISGKVPIMIDLANVLVNAGILDQAYKQYMDALSISRTARDSVIVYNALERFYLTKGQARRSLESHELKLDKYKTFITPKDFLAYRATNLEPYVNAGELNKAYDILEEIAQKLEPPLDNLVPFGYMFIYAETGDVEKAEEAMVGAKDLIKGFGQESMMAFIYYVQGRLNESLGKYQEAIDDYNKFFETNPTSYHIHSFTSRCYRQLKDFKQAEEEIQISLKHRPFSPTCNYEAALLYLETGEEEKGMEHLERAVEIWKDADSDYEKASIAKDKLRALKKASM